MGLIWMLILHYSISMPVWDDEDREVVKETPKQRLMGWIRQKLPSDVPVTNFTSDWNDGIALGALVDAVAPGLNPDWRDWKPKDAEKNTSEAMELAREYLDVPQLLEPHELIDPNVDELSVMTYLSQYPNARLKNDAPLRKRGEPKPSKVTGKAYGPGLKGAVVGASTDFTVEPSDRKKADLVVSVLRPTGGKEAADVYFDEQSGTFGVRYTPQVDGVYKIAVVLAGKPMDGSPFAVPVSVPPVDVSKVHAAGPGLENGVVVAKPTSFDIFTVGAGKSKPDVVIVDKDGKQDTVKPVVKMIDEDVYRVEYVPVTSGLHSVNVFYDRKHITNSPFGVRVVPASYPARVRAWGRGLASRGVRVGDIADFKVSTEGAGDGKVAVFVSGPHGENVPVKQTTDATGAQRFSYAPTKPGDYVVQVKFDGEDVAKSPYQVAVGKPTDLRIRAFGPGLEGGMSNLPANFTVETNGEIGALGFSIEGPSKAKIHCTDNKDGSAEIEYLPTAAGEYEVHVLCGDEDIKDSPFMVEMDEFRDGLRPSLVKCHGQGLQRRGAVKCDKPAEFTVEARGAGPPEIKPKIWVLDKELQPVNVQVLDNGDQTYTCSYLPHAPVKHNVIVSYGGIAVPGSPFRVQVEEAVDPSKVRVHGPGVEPGVRSLQPTHFVIDAKNAGPGEVEVALSDALTGGAVDLDVLDNHDGSFTIKYTAPRPGSYQLRVVFAGHDLLPIQINVQPHLDVGGIRVEGLDN
uniref:Calponin-homology (CH) domain-containing protein n=1 Tax=Plectus sambesii TaxID=2011161 RepID=A0A914UJL9_9BILA